MPDSDILYISQFCINLPYLNLKVCIGLSDVVPIGLWGLQHYLSILRSLLLIPLVIVQAMGGTYNFKQIMKELQGAIIIASAFQAILGYSGLMSIFLRLVNHVVVALTIATVGLSFYSYGFPLVGTYLEIGAVQILLVPLDLAITWAAAFLLTKVGVYSYKGCGTNIPASDMIYDHCRKHISRMKHCLVDTSQALKSTSSLRFPYPLQWGTPVFTWKMAFVMCVVSIVASVDSVLLLLVCNLFQLLGFEEVLVGFAS
ncbi:hypothetical protein UlMin_007049 [Ulmus minor]